MRGEGCGGRWARTRGARQGARAGCARWEQGARAGAARLDEVAPVEREAVDRLDRYLPTAAA
jgi:hypothetical protein